MFSSKRHPIATTTVSKFFTDKHGAAPQDPFEEDSSSSTGPIKRPSLFHRLHLHPSGRRAKTIPNLTIRPTSSSSLPPFPSVESRPGSSHSNAATIAEISQIMSRSLHIDTPPTNSIKRQRSQESGTDVSLSGQASSNGGSGSSGDHDDSAKIISVKMPFYLNKSSSGRHSSPFAD